MVPGRVLFPCFRATENGVSKFAPCSLLLCFTRAPATTLVYGIPGQHLALDVDPGKFWPSRFVVRLA
eukprot:502008-Rhodomonas_salina.2